MFIPLSNVLKINILSVLLICLFFLPSAHAYERLALVIGIDDYKPKLDGSLGFDPLAKAVNDARAIRDTLRNLGFAVVYRENVGKQEIISAIKLFGENLQKDTVGLFYFAGHAIQNGGHNYFIPTNLPNIYKTTKLEEEAISLNLILEEMKEANNEKNIVILDACRDDPELQLAQLPEGARGSVKRAFKRGKIVRGLSKVTNTLVPPKRLLIAYATAANDFSQEPGKKSGEKHSFYTKYLLKYLPKQGYSLKRVLEEVSREVIRETIERKAKGEKIDVQTPWYETAMEEEFYPAGRERMTTNRGF